MIPLTHTPETDETLDALMVAAYAREIADRA